MQAWQQSRAYRVRPSELLHIASPFTAYAVDQCVVMWGTAFEAALHDAMEGKDKARDREAAQGRVVRRWIPSTARYADPARR